MTKTASQMLTELRAEGFFGHVHESGVRCWACEVDLVLAAEPTPESLPAGYIECGNCKSRFLADRGGESCVACGHTLNRTGES